MKEFKQIVLLIIGWCFVGLGVLGLFLPILQGILFIMIGLAILSARSKTVKGWLKDLEARHPRYHQHLDRWRKKIRHWLKLDEKDDRVETD